jgi:predicted phosphoribosyltransferase
MQIFHDRHDAGRFLSQKLLQYKDQPGVIVLGLPRGGVPVAYEVALALHAPLDVFIVMKIGTPGNEEMAMGAIASGGVRIFNPEIIAALRSSRYEFETTTSGTFDEVRRREECYRDARPPLDVRSKVVILVDDGMATGASMTAAVAAIRQLYPAKIVVAVPVAAKTVCDKLAEYADEVICADTPDPFYAIGVWYIDFDQVRDAEVKDLLERATLVHH